MNKVVIIDDNRQTANGLFEQIDWNKINATCCGIAYNGKEGLKLIRENKPNAVITDIKMPLLDGIELAKILSSEFPGIHIIMISAYDNFEYAKAGIEYGVNDYILKPLNRQKIETIEKNLMKFQKFQDEKIKASTTLFNEETLSELKRLIMDGEDENTFNYILSISPFKTASFVSSKDFARNFTKWLYDFQKQCGITKNIFQLSVESSISQIVNCTSIDDLLLFVKTLIKEICVYINNNRKLDTFNFVEEVKKYIDKNINDTELNINKICDKFNISTSYIAALFKSNANTSVNNYIILTRNEKAKTLLSSSSLSISEISTAIGYFDYHYFSRVFKKVNGISPKEYRLLNLKS